MEQPEPSRPASPYRALALVVAAIAALVVVTVVVVLVAGSGDDPQLQPGSPEAALQGYLAAFDDGDLESAHQSFSSGVRAEWDLKAYERDVEEYGMFGEGPARRVLFDRSDTDGDVSRVHLTVEEFYGDGLSGDTIRSSRVVRMVREDGDWRIDERLVWLDPAPIFR